MINANGKSADNPSGKNLFADLVTNGLGYCCVHFFFSNVKAETLQIADRLGVTSRAVRIHKARWKAGEYPCRKCETCFEARKKKGPE